MVSCTQNQEQATDTKKVEVETAISTEKAGISIADPVNVIDRIFTTYNKYEESTDSPANLDSLTAALHQLEDKIDRKDLTLIVDVWMYYTVTDFSAREKAEKVLFAHRQESIEAVKARMKNKKDWETEDSAPFSELGLLLEKLEKA